MSLFSHAGITVDLPSGWEATATGGSFRLLPDGAREPTVVHLGTFPLPTNGASFGADAVGLMHDDDVFMVLFEYGPESVGTPPFASTTVPRSLQSRQFDRAALQRGIEGQSGMQHFFSTRGRAFCLYVVLGSHIDRADLVAKANRVLGTLEIT